MKKRSIIAQLRDVYKDGNKLVRIGMCLVGIGLALLISLAVGVVYLSLSDFPWVGVPVPKWMNVCMIEGMFWTFVGAILIAIGIQPPSGGGGKRKRDRSKGAVHPRAQST